MAALLNSGVNVADIAATGQRQGTQVAAGLEQTGLQSKIEAETVAANLKQQQLDTLAKLLGSAGTTSTLADGVTQAGNSLLESVLAKLGL